jgi:tetratricopeptide (TPR) repeat protein
LPHAIEAVRLQPNDVLPNLNLMFAYLQLNRLEEAKTIYQQAIAKGFDEAIIHLTRFNIAFVEGDAAEMERQSAWAAGKPEEATLLLAQAQTASSRGQWKKAQALFQQAFDTAKRNDLSSSAAAVAAQRATAEYWFGDLSAVKSWSIQSLELSHGEFITAAATLALAGDTARAEKVIDEQGKRSPKGTDVQQRQIPQVRAALAIKRGNPALAIEALKPVVPLEASDIAPTFYRGVAYFSMKSANEAAGEFRKVVDRRTINAVSPLHALSQLQLARSLALAGDTAGARSAYQDLFALWKDADPDLPLLKQAKDEYARLH